MTIALSNPVNGAFTTLVIAANGKSETAQLEPPFYEFSSVDEDTPHLPYPPTSPTSAPAAANIGAATANSGLPVLMIYPIGSSPFAVIRPDSISDPLGAEFLSGMVWDHWTASEAAGTGSAKVSIGGANSPSQTFPFTLSLTNPVAGVFTTFVYTFVGRQTQTYQKVRFAGVGPDSAQSTHSGSTPGRLQRPGYPQ